MYLTRRVFLLVPLKNTLVELSIAHNPRIDDYAVSAILLFSRLSFLSIFETGIGMEGLRRLAINVANEDHIIDIHIPIVCEFYVDSKSLPLPKCFLLTCSVRYAE